MNVMNRDRNHHTKCIKCRPFAIDFSKIGGLSNHIQLLREIIITPLLYGELFHHFNIKAPRGVLFFGPPGTGKTMIAGALATELNRNDRKVTFIQRKGADILDKWVGESERKLRDLFEKAAKYRPSIIFFDELDGLAPERSHKNDQVHCSIVATLLALMDGLDNMPGVIVIGATNRIDAIDPALRRPGRFDRELYFPLPTAVGRREILDVHTNTWKHKPTAAFLNQLSELTAGCCGSDLQALCTEAVMCCVKRLHPELNRANTRRIRMNFHDIQVEECDFLNARMNLVPTAHRLGACKLRSLSQFIAPLLNDELGKILRQLQMFLPHFLDPDKKYLLGNERYAGRLILKGSNQQGLYTHLLPAVLQTLEHLPCTVLEVPHLIESTVKKMQQQLPSILVLSRVDDWWDTMENSVLHILKSILEDFHAGLPLLVIVTCIKLPQPLHQYFYNNRTIIYEVGNPTQSDRESFFMPLFFDSKFPSVLSVWNKHNYPLVKASKSEEKELACYSNNNNKILYNTRQRSRRKRARLSQQKAEPDEVNLKRKRSRSSTNVKKAKLTDGDEAKNEDGQMKNELGTNNRVCDAAIANEDIANDACQVEYMTSIDRNLQNFSKNFFTAGKKVFGYSPVNVKTEPVQMLAFGKSCYRMGESKVMDRWILNAVWERMVNVTSVGLQVTQLELLYDTIKGCIYIYPNEYGKLIKAIRNVLLSFENSVQN